jgi:PST family polysaccharide transporter
MKLVLAFSVPMVIWMIVSRRWLIDILLGQQWTQTVPLFAALGISGIIQPLNNSAGWLMVSQGRSRDVLIWGIIGSAITVAFIVAGLPWGALAVAGSYSAGQILVVTPILWWFTCRKGFIKLVHVTSAAAPSLISGAITGAVFEFIFGRLNGPKSHETSIFMLLVSGLAIFGSHFLFSSLTRSGRETNRIILTNISAVLLKMAKRRRAIV